MLPILRHTLRTHRRLYSSGPLSGVGAQPGSKGTTGAPTSEPQGPIHINQFLLFSAVCLGMFGGMQSAHVVFKPDMTLPMDTAAKALAEAGEKEKTEQKPQ